MQYRVFSHRTTQMMDFDILRLKARIRNPLTGKSRIPRVDKLHFGCGGRRVLGWLNVDVAGSEYDVDLASGCLPWSDAQFAAIVGQHVIEHLELQSELLPLLAELRRVCKPEAEIWLTCPDLERVCASFAADKGRSLIEDRLSRPNTGLGMDGIPSQHMINNVFQQSGEHRNLLDLELLSWALRRSGFINCERVEEKELLTRFPEFPRRNDDAYTLYVRARG
jgi:predicted SAM-dependent methyltransferase